MNFLREMRFYAYTTRSKTTSSRRHSHRCLFYLNKTPIFGQTFLCCISVSTRKSWLRRRPCGCDCPDEMKCQTTLKLKCALKKQWKRIAKSIFPDWTSQPKTPTERSHRLKYRFTSIKHTFLRSEELAKKTGWWEKFQIPHKGSYNKPQFSADPDTHVFDCEQNLHPSAAKCVQILGTKNASGQMSLLNVRWELHKISETNSGALANKTHPPPSRFPYALCRTSPRRLGTNTIIRRSHGTQRTNGRILDGARHFKRRTAIYIYT